MKAKINTLLGAVLSLLALPTVTSADTQVYDLAADFSAVQNPNSVWSYGWSASRGSAFNLITTSGSDSSYGTVIGWTAPYGLTPDYADTDYNHPTVFIPQGTVNIHPGPLGENSVVRWTAPSAGTYMIQGWFKGNDFAYPTSTDVAILHGTDEVFSGEINSYNVPLDFSNKVQANAGDTIDFTVGYGNNGNYFGDSTGVSARIIKTADVADDAIIWHQPLARSGMSEDTDPSAGRTIKYRFKRGSTIPVQIHALNCNGADVTPNANVIGKVTVFLDSDCDGAVDGNDVPININGVGGSGGVMDKIGGHLKYNLDTKSLPTTTLYYILRATITDNSTGEEKFEEVLLQAK